VISIFEKRATGLYHNTALVMDAGNGCAGYYRKMHIPDDPGFYEKFYFTPGDASGDLNGFTPIQTQVGKLGLLVCWDQWYPEAARLMALAGADMLIYPTAIGWNPDDEEEEKQRQLGAWQIIQRGHAVANGLPVIVPNRTGTELSPDGEKIEFWGNSFVAGPQGEILAAAPADEPTTLLVDVDLRRSEEVRRIWPFLRDRRVDAYPNIVRRFID
jgi:N-carbamoylputrescine amidase